MINKGLQKPQKKVNIVHAHTIALTSEKTEFEHVPPTLDLSPLYLDATGKRKVPIAQHSLVKFVFKKPC